MALDVFAHRSDLPTDEDDDWLEDDDDEPLTIEELLDSRTEHLTEDERLDWLAAMISLPGGRTVGRALWPSWQAQAACAAEGVDRELFFPQRAPGSDAKDAIAEAKAICAECSCRQACLDYALKYRCLGVWGGTTEAERRKLQPGKRERRSARAA